MTGRRARAAAAIAAGVLGVCLLPGCGDREARPGKAPTSRPTVVLPPPVSASDATATGAAPPAPGVAASSPGAPAPVAPGGTATALPAGEIAPGSLQMPVVGIDAATLRDSYAELRGNQRHEALDIMAPRGTPVVAVADGRVVKLFNSKPGGLTVYQFDLTQRFAYYYAHLDSYAHNLVEGAELRRGDPIGRVGSSGNASADAPHLHFAVFALGPQRLWWQGTPVNPYPLLEGTR